MTLHMRDPSNCYRAEEDSHWDQHLSWDRHRWWMESFFLLLKYFFIGGCWLFHPWVFSVLLPKICGSADKAAGSWDDSSWRETDLPPKVSDYKAALNKNHIICLCTKRKVSPQQQRKRRADCDRQKLIIWRKIKHWAKRRELQMLWWEKETSAALIKLSNLKMSKLLHSSSSLSLLVQTLCCWAQTAVNEQRRKHWAAGNYSNQNFLLMLASWSKHTPQSGN